MHYLISIALLGISFAPLLFHELDMWHAQGLWAQVSILVLYSYSFFEKPVNVQRLNKPLGLVHLWAGLFTAWFCYKGLLVNKYDTAHFFPYFNFLCILILYNIISQYINREKVEKILNGMRYVVILTLFMSTLQWFGLSQWFKLLMIDVNFNNLVSGFLGNGTHLSGFLGSCVPLFLYRGKREDWLSLGLMFIIMTQSSTTAGDPAVSGFIIGLLTVFFFYKNNRILLLNIFLSFVFLGILLLPHLPHNFFGTSGRINLWKIYIQLFKQVPITGAGLGAVRLISPHTAIPSGKHLHFELFHFAFELGLIGLVLIVNLVKGFFEIKAEDRLELTLKSLIFGFLVSSCFAYPAHLWLPASWAVFYYASYLSIKES